MSSLAEARSAKQRVLSLLSAMPAVVGVGITRVDAGYGVKVNLSQPPGASDAIPKEIDGVPVKVEVVGQIRKRSPE